MVAEIGTKDLSWELYCPKYYMTWCIGMTFC